MHSIEKSGFRFWNLDFRPAIKCKIQKQILMPVHNFFFFWGGGRGIQKKDLKAVLKSSSLPCAHIIISHWRPLFKRTFLQILVQISQWNSRESNLMNFLIEIQVEDRFFCHQNWFSDLALNLKIWNLDFKILYPNFLIKLSFLVDENP